ncbi:cupin domain-containing protein [Pigmentiphaga sp. GD03639]|uniref:Cupin domain-containing protein n=1 Tax=Pigmentiphaga daeguensis TaxID=414049 RepID=A0ABN1BK53_9BURK|nr:MULTISPECIES: cupin domain-containing protein [unclassified Pigmentiphaga]MDH2234868.1 cupin domain-containing protein [Pigmentiphaga sp. GD03639]OVZ57700.1 cupin [Pigmentiphaga sp. NML030171]
MTPDLPTRLLGGLSPSRFMQRHWQRKPLLIRGAFENFRPPLSIAQVKRLARRDDVESRLVWREQGAWQMEHGPFGRLPSAREPEWTLLVQGVNLHDDAAANLMAQFRFIPDARLDDVMISVATDRGGVGPHFDSYDVFLLQASGRRRWRIGRQRDLELDPDAPLKVLRRFEPTEEFVLEAGDMLYLPPAYAHDGIAEGDDCMTISIGFRSPSLAELARGMLEFASESLTERLPSALRGHYKDAGQPAARQPAALPEAMVEAALAAVSAVKFDAALAARYLGRWLTEPKPEVVFDAPDPATLPDLEADWPSSGELVLDRRTLMIHRGRMLFINGEKAEVDATPALRGLADLRRLACVSAKPDDGERAALQEWLEAGWLRYDS